MLHEIAITPSVFYSETYAHPEVCDAQMQGIRDPLLELLLVRDLHGGDWLSELRSRFSTMSRPAKELVKKCILRGRFRVAPAANIVRPATPFEWCDEALASHMQAPLAGVLACPPVKAAQHDNALIASVASRAASPWWQNCVQSCHPDGPRVPRTTAAYLDRLGNILRNASHIIFADPHLDPERAGYATFVELLEATGRSAGPKPLVEIHRVRYEGSGPNKQLKDQGYWERCFRNSLDVRLSAAGVTVEVFIWQDEHDRHLISNLLGLHVGNGFDTTAAVGAVTTWTRLTSREREKVQRFYDPQVNCAALFHRFKIGARSG